MSWLWTILGLIFLLDVVRMRGRAAAIPALQPSDEPVDLEHRFLVAEGVELDPATRRAASAHARQHGLAVLDLVPTGMSWYDAWGTFQVFDPAEYRKDRLGRGVSFGHAVLVTKDVLARAEVDEAERRDALALMRTVANLKRFACTTTYMAVAPGLVARPYDPERRLERLRELVGEGANVVLVGVPVVVLILTAAMITGWPWAGPLTLAAFHLQPALSFVGSRLRVKGLPISVLLRPLLELVAWAGLVAERTPPAPPTRPEPAQRAEYQHLLEDGLDPLFEERRPTCPICDSSELQKWIEVGDLLQNKPGRFALDRCRACAHIFQNPRLSIRGLDFYYKDFYDGLGGENLDRIFGASGEQYLERARMVEGKVEPARWLDVGGGHGHFCCAAREVWPETQFDGLDLSESIEEAKKRGWVDEGYRGLFPDLAPTMANAYDVVSMSHYLEHTREPQAEIEAAGQALRDGGVLLIEVPDPDCPMARILGRLWLPFFQPQHQHLVSVKNLERLLRERGFSPLVWHRGRAHIKVDFLAALVLALNWMAPEPGVPWRPVKRGAAALRTTVFTLALPAFVVARILDAVVGTVVTRSGGSNAYRVLARKVGVEAAV
ncbi:MAG: class I SAM-dependent methyltransferase [Polyangiaceae bacterium]